MVGLIDIPWIGVKIQWHQKALSDSHSTFSPHRISCSYRNGLFAPIHWIWDKPSLIPSLLASVSRMNLLTPASTCEYVKRGAEHSHDFKCLKTDWTTGGHSFSPLVSEMVKWRHNRNMTGQGRTGHSSWLAPENSVPAWNGKVWANLLWSQLCQSMLWCGNPKIRPTPRRIQCQACVPNTLNNGSKVWEMRG